MKLKSEIAKILGHDVEQLGWDEAFKRSATTGKHDNKHLADMIKAICKHLDPFIPDVINKPLSANEQVHIYNPLTKDVNVYFDVLGNGAPMQFTARSQEITAFDPKVAVQMKKYLINEILQQKGIGYPTDKDIQQAEKDISLPNKVV